MREPIVQRSTELVQCLSTLLCGLGVYEVSDAFGFRETETPVLERPSREFSRQGRATTRRLQGTRNTVHDGDAPMKMQLHDVLARETRRTPKPGDEGLVQNGAAVIQQPPHLQGPDSRHWTTGQAFQHTGAARPGHPHHREGRPTGGRGESIDRIIHRLGDEAPDMPAVAAAVISLRNCSVAWPP